MQQLLQSWVTRHAEIRPDARAVVDGQESLTYAQLEDFSSRLAAILRVAGCTRGDRVCLLMPKSATAIASILAIYKADCIYVPLDTSCPSSRLIKMITSAGAQTILAAGPVIPLLNELYGDRPVKQFPLAGSTHGQLSSRMISTSPSLWTTCPDIRRRVRTTGMALTILLISCSPPGRREYPRAL